MLGHAVPGADPGRFARTTTSTVLAASIAVAFVVVIIAFQPLGSPWWINADADASYTASGIDLMAGEHTTYLDQPGLPLEDLMAITTETRYIAHKLTSEHETPHTYAGGQLLHLDGTRIFFRGYAILFALAGALLAFVGLMRLLGNPWWGAMGAVLFLAAPGVQAMSIQFRPDVLLAALALAVAYLVARATQRRDAWLYTLAALLLGIAMTVETLAVGLALPLAIALLVRPPASGSLVSNGRAWLLRYRVPLVAFFGIWTLLCVTFDRNRLPIRLTHGQRELLVAILLVVAAYAGLVFLAGRVFRANARGPLRPAGLALMCAFLAGILLPGTLVIDDLPEMLVKIAHGIAHGGVGQVPAPPSIQWSDLAHAPLLQTAVLLALAAVSATLGLIGREVQPLLWFSGAAAVFAMAAGHVASAAEFAPAFVLSVPPVLLLTRRLPRPAVPVAAAAVLAFTLVPVFQNLAKPADAARHQERQWNAIASIGDRLLTQPGTVAFSEASAPIPDVRWATFVQQVVPWTPSYPYRFIPASPEGVDAAQNLHLVPQFYIGSLVAGMAKTGPVALPIGGYVLKPLPLMSLPSAGIGAAQIVHGP